jgi:hypothetical protein
LEEFRNKLSFPCKAGIHFSDSRLRENDRVEALREKETLFTCHCFFLFLPALPVFFPLDCFGSRSDGERAVRIDHHGAFVGAGQLILIAEGFRMRTVMDALRMERQHCGFDIIAAEEIAVMIEEHFIVVGVAMIEGDFERILIFFERTRQEGADDKILRNESRMHRRRKMNAR